MVGFNVFFVVGSNFTNLGNLGIKKNSPMGSIGFGKKICE